MPDLAPPMGDCDFYFVLADEREAVAKIVELARTRRPRPIASLRV
jgi:hypothetical protein